MSNYKYAHCWDIHETPEETERVVLELEKAVQKNNTKSVKKILKDPSVLRSITIRRGQNGKNHKIFLKSFDFLLEDEFGENENAASFSVEKILDFLHREDIPEQVLNSLAIVAFHAQNKELFFNVIDGIIGNFENFLDREVVIEAQHDLASWKSFYEKNKKEAININRWIIGECDKIGAGVLRKKTTFGLAYDKEIKHKSKAESFKKTGEELKEKFNNKYNALRMEMAYGESLLLYAKLKSGLHREKILREAKDVTLEALKSSIKSGYMKAEMKISKLLGEIYLEIGDERKAKSYRKRFEKIEDGYY
ncbi:MAG: hypothetical protein Athens101428_149 [Candidatus Berkelbacteria bacterium Athens1014_28]|uniref:Uncharacterized protein n=1 Tax=Candidatus Berkelbacteria bacterium Athens1014_28 TaxID=2017145 RepID=A0A554LPR2_9BACT|nr:MAG: hypothetical protein Athens101428_149 [Candidatus Berkelbacteria bacterium Athens1014_28]